MDSLVVVGACYLDTILTVPYYPREDEKLRAESLSQRRGGNGPNTLEVLAQLLAHSAAVDLIKASLGPAVNLSACIYREGRTEAASSYIIQSTESGSRTLVNYNDLPELTLKEFEVVVSEKVGQRGKWYHFEGRIPDVTQGCIRHLREKLPNTAISVEVEKPGRAGLEELAAEADVVFYSQSWAKSKGYSTRKECLRAQALVAQRASTGAGDAFIAGILFGLLAGGLDSYLIPYVPPQEDNKPDFGSTFTSTMPMAAMFTRNRAIGWHVFLSNDK
ncbi:hypothetical protein DV738_g4384, partial [Chaetothyriales sp. CBS 135597]